MQNNLTYFIETYGCQMNTHDSEKICGILESIGYCHAQSKKDADLILFNTCCIREHAEERLYGNIGALKRHKDKKPNAIIGVCGCMTQQKDTAEGLQKRFKFVDIVFGTNKIHMLPDMLHDVMIDGKRAAYTDEDASINEGVATKRKSNGSAYVNIIYGCNNYCTYCIVPYVRGAERSRKSADILREVKTLCSEGVKEITLLGQNVNSYGTDLQNDLSFPQLLREIDKQTDVKRLRFMTSHPKDLTDELLACYGDLPSLCEHIHLPVQSGSNSVLTRMNRRYTREHYIGLTEQLRARVPNISITTDIIVGFPGETEEEFSQTMDLAEQIGFDSAYTFVYSSRPGTAAADMSDHLDQDTKSERLARLNVVIKSSMRDKNSLYDGQIVKVLVDGARKRTDGEVGGRTRTAKTVNFLGETSDIGKIVNVRINKVKVHTLYGEKIGEEMTDA
ncbi:MAG: tRNA (N6-isopentenyl adenosine(37)-C2)-methylthiotransferase MiaB [Clostridia bacterium]|nr:tRNA (N6-isopentenyl adenosine(37)-C2)-methylthiotransferase MiaB [Clostridia bacterium]MBT7122226.1 tRNA (N6-isopentenyl adenosine(37)-C2)-methylthiotransferase MiaB [Clostridia bacterium]